MSFRSVLEHRARALTPRRLRPVFSRAYYVVLDGMDRLAGGRDPMTPPRSLLRISTDPDSDYRATGRAFLDFLRTECGLRSDDAVLDVGCGVGRLAVGLTEYLSPSARYEGFDIVPREIAWCRRSITPRFPNFRFHVADVRNDAYNPSGKTTAAQYRFPYDDRAFDVVILASVFTHLLSRDMENYVAEVARVLKPGGRCVASFYLLNAATRACILAGTSAFAFTVPVEQCVVEDPDRPEWAVAHDETLVQRLFAREGLEIATTFHGRWSSDGVQVQDLIIASRSPSS